MTNHNHHNTTLSESLRQEAVQECISWLTKDFQQSLPFGVEFRCSTDTNNFGVFATRTLPTGQVLWTIPNTASICERLPAVSFLRPLLNSAMVRWTHHLQERNPPSEFRTYIQNCLVSPGEYRMGLLLCVLLYQDETKIWKKEEDSSSPVSFLKDRVAQAAAMWSPFFPTWPDSLKGNPLYWSEEELQELVGTPFHERAVQLQNEVQELWHFAIWPALKEFPLLQNNPSVDDLESKLRSLFYKGLALVRSRAYGSEDDFDREDWRLRLGMGNTDPTKVQFPKPILYPLIDIINGAPNDTSVNVTLSGFDKFLNGSNKVVTTREIQPGEEIIIDYGDSINNVDYFEKFGFIPTDPTDHQPTIHRTDKVNLEMPPILIPSDNDTLRWQQFEQRGLTQERLLSSKTNSSLFFLLGDEQLLRQYRYQPPEDAEKRMNPQIHRLMLFAYVIRINDKAPEEEPKCWEHGKVVVEILDHALSKLPATIKDQCGMSETQRTAALACTLTRDILVRWRHAVCVQEQLYKYQEEAKLPTPPELSPTAYCQTCRSSLHLQNCSNCGEVCYCSEACQREHWREHQKLCQEKVQVNCDEPIKLQI